MAGRALQITYVGDASKVIAAQRSIDAGHTKMQGGVTKASGAFKSAYSSVIPISAAAGALAVVALAKTVITAAADEGEALNKASVIFGQSAESVIRFSDTAASAFGISKAAALEAAGGFGAMFQSSGLAEGAASDMSIAMVKLAADMASFNNQDPTEMLDKLRSGLAGESEPLRQFGVFITEGRVKMEAYASGIAAAGEELTDAQKIQARYNLILQDTTRQQGDFARTADTLPNQLRTLGAEFTDLAADLGKVFLPIAIAVVSTIGDLVESFQHPFGQVLSMEEATEALAAGGEVAELLRIALEGAAEQGSELAKEMLALVDTGSKVGEVIGGLGPVITAPFDDLQGALDEAGDAVSGFAGMTVEEFDEWRAKSEESFNAVSGVVGELADQSNLTADEIIRAFRRQLDAMSDYQANWETLLARGLPDSLAQQIQEMGIDGAEFVAALAGANKKQFGQIMSDWKDAQGVSKEVTGAVGVLGQSVKDLPNRAHITITADVTDALHGIGLVISALGQIVGDFFGGGGGGRGGGGGGQRGPKAPVLDEDLIEETKKRLTGQFFGVKTDELIREIRRLQAGLVFFGSSDGGGSGFSVVGGGFTVGGGAGGFIPPVPPPPLPPDITPGNEMAAIAASGRGAGGRGFGGGGIEDPPIIVNINVEGSVHDSDELARKIRDELVRMQRRNVSTGLV